MTGRPDSTRSEPETPAADPLAGRVARFADLEPSSALFIDTMLPGYARTIWSIVGQNVGEDRETQPAIPPDGFHLAVIEAEPGNGSALHTHTTVEVFMPLTGCWTLFYDDEEERAVTLGQWDVCSVPPGVWRGFRNAGEGAAHLLVLVGGTDAGASHLGPGRPRPGRTARQDARRARLPAGIGFCAMTGSPAHRARVGASSYSRCHDGFHLRAREAVEVLVHEPGVEGRYR